MDMLGGLVLIASMVLVLLAGVAVIAVRIVHGREGIEQWPGWACWGGHIIFSWSAFVLTAWLIPKLIVSSWPMTKHEMVTTAILAMLAMAGAYFFGIWFIGHGRDK